MKMWSGRFRQPLDADFERWQRSFDFDRRLLRQELAASGALAYACRRAEGFAAHAAAQLTFLPPSEGKTILEHLTDKVVHREC